MTYKQIINKVDTIDYRDVENTASGFIVGKYAYNIAYIIINNDWYLISKDGIQRNSTSGNTLNYIFNNDNDEKIKDVRYYTDFKQAVRYIIDIVYAK